MSTLRVIAMRDKHSPQPVAGVQLFRDALPFSLRAADGCIAGTMREPNGAKLTSDAALLVSYVTGLLVCHALSRRVAGGWTTAWSG
jgi:hypothetical protein